MRISSNSILSVAYKAHHDNSAERHDKDFNPDQMPNVLPFCFAVVASRLFRHTTKLYSENRRSLTPALGRSLGVSHFYSASEGIRR